MKSIILFAIFATAFAVECPPGAENVLIGNPYDCTTFYACVGGTPILEHCPPGLEWNEAVKNCDWPENANCQASSNTPEPTGSTSSTQSGGSSDPSTSTAAPTVDPEYPTTCPPKDGPTDVLLKNPKDCHSFFKCLKGKPYLIECPAGQEWADHLKRCDWPEIANCKVEAY